MNYWDEPVEAKRVILEKFKYAIKASIAREDLVMPEIRVNSMVDVISRNIVMRFQMDVFGQKLEDIKYPLNWWEAVKERFGPQWFLKRYPVKYQVITMEAIYPQLALPYEHERAVIHYVKQPKWWEGQ